MCDVVLGKMYCFFGRNAAKLHANNMNRDAAKNGEAQEYIALYKHRAYGVVKDSEKDSYIKDGWVQI